METTTNVMRSMLERIGICPCYDQSADRNVSVGPGEKVVDNITCKDAENAQT